MQYLLLYWFFSINCEFGKLHNLTALDVAFGKLLWTQRGGMRQFQVERSTAGYNSHPINNMETPHGLVLRKDDFQIRSHEVLV